MILKFTYDGQPYEYSNDTLSLGEARYVKKHTGLGLQQWFSRIGEFDPDSILVLIILAVRRAGKKLNWEDIPDDFDLMSFITSVDYSVEPEVTQLMSEIEKQGKAPVTSAPAE